MPPTPSLNSTDFLWSTCLPSQQCGCVSIPLLCFVRVGLLATHDSHDGGAGSPIAPSSHPHVWLMIPPNSWGFSAMTPELEQTGSAWCACWRTKIRVKSPLERNTALPRGCLNHCRISLLLHSPLQDECIYICVYMCIDVCIYKYTYIYTQIYIYVCVCACIFFT